MKRAKENCERRGYKYAAKPLDRIPDSWWQEHRAMVDYWNRLVTLSDWIYRLNVPVDALGARPIAGGKKKDWQDFMAYDMCGKGHDMYWANLGAVLDAFKVSKKTALKNFASGVVGSGMPKRKKYWFSPSFFKAQSGGWTVDQLFGSPKQLFLTLPDKKKRSILSWTMKDEIVRFEVILHRPLPDDATIKNVRLRQDRDKKWFVSFNLQFPEQEKSLTGDVEFHFEPKWSVDFFLALADRKKFNQKGDLIIGNLTANQTESRLVTLFSAVDSHEQPPKHDIFARIDRAEKLQQQASEELEIIKSGLGDYIAEVKHAMGWKSDLLPKCGAAGLKKLFQIWDAKEVNRHPFILEFKRKLKRYDSLMREKRGIQGRITRHRDWCYWNFAKDIAERAKVVYLKDISFKKLGMTTMDDQSSLPKEVQRAIRRNKSYAAHGDLYAKIEQQCKKHGVEVIKMKEAVNG